MFLTKIIRRSPRAAMVVLTAVVAAALTGCTGQPDDTPTAATFLPAPSASELPGDTAEPSPPSPSAHPTAAGLTPPVLPEAATQETPEGAAAFAAWWFDTLNYATATGDTSSLRAATQTPTCASCMNFIDEIESTYQQGDRFVGGELSYVVEMPDLVDERVATLPIRVEVAEGAVVTASGASEALPAESLVLVAAAVWVDSAWLMGDLKR